MSPQIQHGTYAGYQQHKRRGEEACTACCRATAMWKQLYRARNACTPGLGWPLRGKTGIGPAGQVPPLSSERRKRLAASP